MKGSLNSTSIIILITISFLFVFVFNFRDVYAVTTKHLCRLEQRDALLVLKNEFEVQKPCIHGDPKIDSWANNSDCCLWQGIGCDAKSGQVIELYLSSSCLKGQIPSSIANLSYLTALTLNYNNLSGQIPYSIANLSHLTFLDLSSNNFIGTLPSSLFNIPSLILINLRDNQLNDTLEFGNMSSPSELLVLYLENNNFRGPIPRSISKLTNLELLDLSHFNAQGPIDFSIFFHLKSLLYLILSNLNTTTTIDLNAILSYFKELFLLDLSGNHVSATNKSSASKATPHLRSLDLSGCGITEFPEFIRTQQQIQDLDLSNNRIKGQVPSWLWSLPGLDLGDLSNNSFRGFDGFTNDIPTRIITVVDLSSNDFQGPFFVPPVPIAILVASRNNFYGEIPKSICGRTSLNILDLSNNSLNGSIPQCLENLIKKGLSVLSLSDNHLSGILPEIFINGCSLRSFNVGHNSFVGKLPRSLKGCSGLEVLNVEHNRFNDAFPFWLQPLERLQVLLLRSNEFHGSLHPPNISSGFMRLQIIDVSQNDFMGTLPSVFFMYWSAMISKGVNRGYIGQGMYYKDSLVLINKGVEMRMERVFTLLTAIDFSRNKLSGEIPESIGVLKGLIVLNLSNNHFEGNIPSTMANLTELESLDLSRNMLSGKIPPQLGKLTFVEIMDFSHNKLVGMIPGNTQFQTQNPSRFEDNGGLCGPPLGECGVVHEPSPSQEPDEEEEEVLSWTAATIGVGPGIVLGLTIGYVMMSYKPHWFFKLFQLVSSFMRFVNKKP